MTARKLGGEKRITQTQFERNCKKIEAARPLAVGDSVRIIRNSHWDGHWGTIIRIDDNYHVSGGSIGELTPVFDRDELVKRVL